MEHNREVPDVIDQLPLSRLLSRRQRRAHARATSLRHTLEPKPFYKLQNVGGACNDGPLRCRPKICKLHVEISVSLSLFFSNSGGMVTYVLRARLDICRMENELSGAHACRRVERKEF